MRQRGRCRAARLIRRGGSLGVGVEQQLYHLERRTLGGGVVQGQLYVLRGAATWMRPKGKGDKEHTEPCGGGGNVKAGVITWAVRRAWATTAAACRLAASSSFITSNAAPLAAA